MLNLMMNISDDTWIGEVISRVLKKNRGAGEMAQRLRAPAALAEVLSSTLSNHMVAHNCL